MFIEYQSETFFDVSELFFICMVFNNNLTLFQNLATIMRQRQSTLMAKPTDLSRLDKVLRES